MARISRSSPSFDPITNKPVTGRYTIDINTYDGGVDEFLRVHGAIEWSGYKGGYAASKFKTLHFPGCKPVYYSGPGARLFFNDPDVALLFSVVYGHYITHSNVKEIHQLLEENTR